MDRETTLYAWFLRTTLKDSRIQFFQSGKPVRQRYILNGYETMSLN